MTRKPKTSDTQNTQGAEDSLEGAQPDQAEAPMADPQEQAAAPAAEGDASAAAHDAGEDGPGAPAPMVTVICHRDGGRRRAGRRWPQGETILPAGDLQPFELAQLQGDPQFTVRVG